MEHTQQEVIRILLERLFFLQLISNATRLAAEDLAYSVIELPTFFGYPVRLETEDGPA